MTFEKDDADLDAEVLLGHCALRVFFSDRALEAEIGRCCGRSSVLPNTSLERRGMQELTLYGPLADLLPVMIRLQEALPGRVETVLRIGVRLGTRPLLAHVTVEPETPA